MHQPARSVSRLPFVPGQLSAALLILASAAAEAQAMPSYFITDLGTLGGSASDAEDINNLGQIVGYAQTTGDAAIHASLWQDGVAQDLGTLKGSGNSWAYGINERGQVVGDSEQLGGVKKGGGGIGGKVKGGALTTTLPVLWQNGSIQALSASAGSAQDINEAGQVAGYTVFKLAETHATIWQNGSELDLQRIVAGDSSIQAINDSGQMAGYVTASTWLSPASWDSPGSKPVTGKPALGAYQDINNSGQMVGVSGKLVDSGSAGIPFMLTNGTARALPTLDGQTGTALGLNESGWAVGWSQTATAGQHATLWQNGQVFDLNSLLDPGSASFTLSSANAINDFGQIVGQLATGHAYLADPAGTVAWTGGSGSWETGANWGQGFKPGKLQDLVIAPGAGVAAISGPLADAKINSLTLGGGAGSADLKLDKGKLAVNGAVQVKANSHLGVTVGNTLAATGRYIQTGGSASVDGVLRAASIDIQSGVLDGTGTLQGNVTIGAGASLNPGHSPGTLVIAGDFILNGTLNIEIASSTVFDSLDITGNADFSAGTLNFSFINGFVPQPGDLFQWLNISGNVTGLDLARVQMFGLPAGLDYGLGTTGHALQISAVSQSAVPAPTTGWLLLAGLLGLRRCRD